MAKTDNPTDFLTDLANTIRTEENTTAKIDPKKLHNKIPEFGKRLKNHNENMQKVFETYKVSDSGFNWTEYENNENYPDSNYANTLEGLKDLLTDIADNIRTEGGSTEKINPQLFSDKIISFGDEIKKQNEELESALGVYRGATTYGVKLDKSILYGDQWASYTDDAEREGLVGAYMDFANDTFVDNGWTNRWPYNQIKPCLLKDGQVVGYLNPNDYTKFENGTDAGITDVNNGLVMIEIPKIYYHISRDENFIYVKISDTAQDGFVCNAHAYKGQEVDKIYVSAYLSGTTGKISSRGFATASGEILNNSDNISYSGWWSILQSKQGSRFEFMPFNVLVLIQCLYIIMFNNTDCQKFLGYGYNTYQTTHTVGQLDKMGMYYGKEAVGSSIKFLGLENIYGCRKQMGTGFDVIGGVARYIDVYDPEQTYAPLARNYKDVSNFIKPSNYLRNAIDVQEDAIHSGFWGSEVTTSKTRGFCDQTSYTSADGCCLDFGMIGTGDVNGIFSMIIVKINTGDARRSARTVYYPEV